MNDRKLASYRRVDLSTRVLNANSHQLIQMLYDGAIERLAVAKGALSRDDVEVKGLMIGKAISIISGLRNALDMEVDSELPKTLDQLYEYMQFRLLEANSKNDESMIEEVLELIKVVKSGWDELAV